MSKPNTIRVTIPSHTYTAMCAKAVWHNRPVIWQLIEDMSSVPDGKWTTGILEPHLGDRKNGHILNVTLPQAKYDMLESMSKMQCRRIQDQLLLIIIGMYPVSKIVAAIKDKQVTDRQAEQPETPAAYREIFAGMAASAPITPTE